MIEIETRLEDKNIEQPEGIDDRRNEPFDLGDYPIDSILIRKDINTVGTIVNRIKQKRFILDPDFQRDYLWSIKKASRLIESLILRIPIPVFYLAERTDGKIIVVDGLQRLYSFYIFCNNEFKLTGLKTEQLDGKYYKDLPVLYQERINDTNLTLYLLDPKAPERIRLDIFDRVNSGVPLTRQQMRNSLYCGEATKWLKSMAHHELFLQVTTGSLDAKTMRDREFINRFCGFYFWGPEGYKNRARGDMDDFLAQTLQNINTHPNKLVDLEHSFLVSMQNNYTVFGTYAFRKHFNNEDRRSVINASLFDVFSVLFAKLKPSVALNKKVVLQQKFYNLMNNNSFTDAITIGTGDVKKVEGRFFLASNVYKEFLNDR